MIIVTGASGQLGRLVIESLLKKLPSSEIAAAVRNPDKVKDLTARGIQVRHADYDQPDTLAKAMKRGEKLLMISASEVGRRAPQHRALIEAAKSAGVSLITYTSILHADTSPLPLAVEHNQTEAMLRASGVPFVLLRNGWYTENYTASIPPALQHGVFLGSAGDGRISSAARADYAQAAAAVMVTDHQVGNVYELAGDTSYTLTELAAEISHQSGKAVTYQNLPEAEYRAALIGAGLPEPVATLLAESDVGASKGGLFDVSRQLRGLIGRPTTSLESSVKATLSSMSRGPV